MLPTGSRSLPVSRPRCRTGPYQIDGTIAPSSLWQLHRKYLPRSGPLAGRTSRWALGAAPQALTLFASLPLINAPWRPLGHRGARAITEGPLQMAARNDGPPIEVLRYLGVGQEASPST